MKQPAYQKVKQLGVVLDVPAEETPPENWTGCQNMAFKDGYAYRTGGHKRYASPTQTPPLFAMNVIIGVESFWIYCGATQVWVTNGVTHWNITPAGGLSTTQPGEWTGCMINGIPCLNNQHNPPFYWALNTSVPAVTLPGWPAAARCKALRASKYHLFALNIIDGPNQYPDQLWWSAGAQAGNVPQEWVPTAANDAGDVILADTPGHIVDGLGLRDVFMVYKEYAVHILQYVAGQFVWTQRKLFTTIGVQGLNCVVEAAGFHWVFTGTDVVRHDGQNLDSVVDEKVKETLVKSIEPSRRGLCQVVERQLGQQVWVCIPEANQQWQTKAYIIDVVAGDIGIRLLPNLAGVFRGIVADPGTGNAWDTDPDSWDSDPTFWNQQSYSITDDSLLMVDNVNSRLYSVDTSDTADGAMISSYLERLSAPLGAFEVRKLVTRLVPRIDGVQGDVIMITMGGQSYFHQPIRWGTPQPFVIGQSISVDDIVEGRLVSVRFEGTTQGSWRLYQYAVRYVEQGEF